MSDSVNRATWIGAEKAILRNGNSNSREPIISDIVRYGCAAEQRKAFETRAFAFISTAGMCAQLLAKSNLDFWKTFQFFTIYSIPID